MPTDHNSPDRDLPVQKAPQRRRFHLAGHSAPLDPSVDAVRDDLADVELADRVFAPHYAQSLAFRAIADGALRGQPTSNATIIRSISSGDIVDVFDISGSWAWVRAAGFMGYVMAETIEPL